MKFDLHCKTLYTLPKNHCHNIFHTFLFWILVQFSCCFTNVLVFQDGISHSCIYTVMMWLFLIHIKVLGDNTWYWWQIPLKLVLFAIYNVGFYVCYLCPLHHNDVAFTPTSHHVFLHPPPTIKMYDKLVGSMSAVLTHAHCSPSSFPSSRPDFICL